MDAYREGKGTKRPKFMSRSLELANKSLIDQWVGETVTRAFD
jgi:hypothetical protein